MQGGNKRIAKTQALLDRYIKTWGGEENNRPQVSLGSRYQMEGKTVPLPKGCLSVKL